MRKSRPSSTSNASATVCSVTSSDNSKSRSGRSIEDVLQLISNVLVEDDEQNFPTSISNSPKTAMSDSEPPRPNSMNLDSVNSEVSNAKRMNSNDSNSILCSVVWTKPSNKKHKTWEGDGMLKLIDGKATLTNVEGQFLGQVENLKTNLEEGVRLIVGSKEVEIIDIISKREFDKIPKVETKIPRVAGLSIREPYVPKRKVILNPVKIGINDDSQNRRLYSVVWAKPNNRKNKSWEGDGTLEIVGGKATLKDTEGQFLGQIDNLKINVEEGVRLVVGNKEVEIIDIGSAMETDKIPIETPATLLQRKPGRIAKANPHFQTPIITEIKSMDVEAKSESTCVRYNVMWGKPSTKKRKSWEGDGVLEVAGDSAILKNTLGKILGRMEHLNTELEEGTRFLVGGKEVEILKTDFELKEVPNVENKKTSIVKRWNENASNADFAKGKKRKITSFLIPSSEGVKPLIMPKSPGEYAVEVKLDTFLTRLLRPHQREGVTFLYSCVTGLKNENYCGAILADEMGLGKTLQTICLIWLLLRQGPLGQPLVKKVLIVTPSSLAGNWLNEFKKWLTFERLKPFVVNQNQKPSDYIEMKSSGSSVMIISYEMLVRCSRELQKINFGLIVCDEGHRLKNANIRASSVLDNLKCDRRVILTGTPMQNDLQEFFALVNFANPGFLDSYSEFKRNYENAIVLSNQPGCSHVDAICGKEKAAELNSVTSAFILRRTQNIINRFLPSKQECVVFCKPTELQGILYEKTIKFWEMDIGVPHLSVVTALRQICSHPTLLFKKTSVEDREQDEEGIESLKTRLRSTLRGNNGESVRFQDSGKMLVLNQLIARLKDNGEKIVVVSYSTRTLDFIQELCSSNGYDFMRLDGTTPSSTRMDIVNKFNGKFCTRLVMLLSAKAGGVGLNLVGASRLVLFDSDWNPASDLQAMARIWRDGQKSKVFIYRFLTSGTIEEKIYQRQISKTYLSDSVMDTKKSGLVKLSREELKDLFSFAPSNESTTHELLRCDCEGNGVPKMVANGDSCDDDSFETNSDDSCTINELMRWEHYSQPVDQRVLQELLLEDASDDISFLFRNKP